MNYSTTDQVETRNEFMVTAFPAPGMQVRLAYRDINLALNGNDEQKEEVGPYYSLPKPWIPSTCTSADLRFDLWRWLGEVVGWLNREYTWEVSSLIPGCWAEHPHIVNELAVVADQRRRCEIAETSMPMEEWHRYTLPSFIARMKERTRNQCEDQHQSWPGRNRYFHYLSHEQGEQREERYALDLDAAQERARSAGGGRGPLRIDSRSGLIDD